MEEHRGGVLKLSELLLKITLADFLSGKKRIVNKGLKLWGIKRVYTDFNLAFDEYRFFFSADDLPLLQEECYPGDLELKQIEEVPDCFKLVPIE